MLVYLQNDTICGIINSASCIEWGDKMARDEKLIARIKSKPLCTDITIDELVKYLQYHGYVEKGRKSTSHRQFIHPVYKKPITLVSHGKPMLVAYVKEAIRLVEEITENESK